MVFWERTVKVLWAKRVIKLWRVGVRIYVGIYRTNAHLVVGKLVDHVCGQPACQPAECNRVLQ